MGNKSEKKPYSDERWLTDFSDNYSFCNECVYRELLDAKCKAFPDGIPRRIFASDGRDPNAECANGIYRKLR